METKISNTILQQEFKYYIEHENELLKKYNNKYIVIVDKNIIGNYDNILEAIEETSKKYKLGTFLIQECKQGAYLQKFYSRVSF